VHWSLRIMNLCMYTYVCLLIGQSEQIPQRGIYEPAREVEDYAAFAPPTTGDQELEMSPR